MSKVCAFVVLLLLVVVAGALDGATAKDNTMVTMGMQISPSPAPAPAPALTPSAIDCGDECSRRCSKTWNKKMCLRLCGICCGKCKCVPSGSAGNKDECPCYRDWKNKKGKDKCP